MKKYTMAPESYRSFPYPRYSCPIQKRTADEEIHDALAAMSNPRFWPGFGNPGRAKFDLLRLLFKGKE
jgi:hypothetical protein